MKFSDIDFSAIHQMMNAMSDEEKASLNDMATHMMNNMKEEPDEELNIYEFLHIRQEDYSDLAVLDQIETAVELEDFYDGDFDADYSAAVLFYAKAVLNLLRKTHFSVYANVLSAVQSVATTTMYSYLTPLMNDKTIHTLVDKGFGTTEEWIAHKNALQQICTLLNRAEYDAVHYEELQSFKTLLFEQRALLRIKELIASK